MDMRFPENGWHPGCPDNSAEVHPLDWHGLRARLRAGQDLRRLFAAEAGGNSGAGVAAHPASFHWSAAQILADCRSEFEENRRDGDGAVNLMRSRNGKAADGMSNSASGSAGVDSGSPESRFFE